LSSSSKISRNQTAGKDDAEWNGFKTCGFSLDPQGTKKRKTLSRMGLLRSFRDIWKQYRSFGDAELDALKRKVLANRELLRNIKRIQESNDKLAESAVLTAIKETVDEMQALKSQADEESRAARLSLKELESKVERELALDEKRKTVELLQSVDLSALVGGKATRLDTKEDNNEEDSEEDNEEGRGRTGK